MIKKLPNGKAALHPLWPDARWNISGLFVRDKLIYEVYNLMREKLNCLNNIDSIHGAPAVAWNSGRVSKVALSQDLSGLETIIRLFNAEGIGIFYTFTSHLIQQRDLSDTTCNRLLDMIDNGKGLNGAILANETLLDYLRQEHPDLKVTASIVKVSMENGAGDADYYCRQSDRFDSVMVHPDDGFNYDLLDKLDREKMEIIVNENCVLECDVRARHYELMAEHQKRRNPADYDGSDLAKHEDTVCQMPLQKFDGINRPCNFTADELKQVYDMGFRRFKLQGRADSPTCYLFDLLRYLLEPNLVMPLVFKSFTGGWAKKHAAELIRKRLGNKNNL